MHHARPIFFLLFTLFAPALAAAQSGRLADATTENGDAVTVVWLTPRVAYARVPLVSVCWDGTCAPVVTRQSCQSPDCPAAGWRLATENDLAEVPRWRASAWVEQMTPILDDPRGARLLDGVHIHPPVPRPSDRMGRALTAIEAQTRSVAPDVLLDCDRLCGDGIACHRLGTDAADRPQVECEAGEVESPLIWLTPRTAFAEFDAERACFEDRCAPAIAHEHCRPPECPGTGIRIHVAVDLADVDPWPADPTASDRVVERIRADPRAAQLRLQTYQEQHEMNLALASEGLDSFMVGHPSYAVGWVHHDRPTLSVEFAGGFTLGSFVNAGGTWVGGSFSTTLQLDLDTDVSDGDAYRVMEAFLFDGAGLSVTAQALSRTDGPAQGNWLISVGGGIALSNRLSPSGVRLPTLLGAIVPEVGAVFRHDLDASAYLAWSAPLAWMLLPHFGVDVRPRVLLVFPPDDTTGDIDVFVGITVGVISPMLGSTELRFGTVGGGGLVR